MKIPQIIILAIYLLLLVSSCGQSDYEGSFIQSPTRQFKIKASVNRTDKKKKDFGEVIIQIFDESNKKLSEIQSGVGDFSKWTLGWTSGGDTIILQSSDLGNKAWIIEHGRPKEIILTNSLNERAKELKAIKYN